MHRIEFGQSKTFGVLESQSIIRGSNITFSNLSAFFPDRPLTGQGFISGIMAFAYTIFFIDWETCKDFLKDIQFPSKSQIELHVFFRKDADQKLLKATLPDRCFYEDGRPAVVKHSSLTAFPNAVEDVFAYFVSSYDYTRFKKPDVYLVSGDGRRYEELAKILRKDKRVSAWVIDGVRTSLLDWIGGNHVCKPCKTIFTSAQEGAAHYDQEHFKQHTPEKLRDSHVLQSI